MTAAYLPPPRRVRLTLEVEDAGPQLDVVARLEIQGAFVEGERISLINLVASSWPNADAVSEFIDQQLQRREVASSTSIRETPTPSDEGDPAHE